VKGGNTGEVENPGLKADIGEDPERFLDQPIDYDDQWPIARIMGIDSLRVVRIWKRIETDPDRAAGEPREQIIQLLAQREAYLEAHGDRAERTAGETHDRDLKPAAVTINGEPVAEQSRSATEKLAAMRSDSGSEPAVATDGGTEGGQ
jgi:hypothetical protein